MTDSRLLRLHPNDSVVVVTRTLEASETIALDGIPVVVPQRITLGHKLAARALRPGEKVFKYGVAIGSATRNIALGEHVHLHNLQSDYLPTYTLEESRRYVPTH